MAETIKNTQLPHELIMKDRKRISVTGVTEVVSFDELSVVLKTACGELTVDGEGLHISASCKKLCEKLLKNEITFEEYLSQILSAEDSDCSEKM